MNLIDKCFCENCKEISVFEIPLRPLAELKCSSCDVVGVYIPEADCLMCYQLERNNT